MRLIDANKLKKTIKKLDVESFDIKTERIINRTIQEIFPQIIDDEPTFEHEGCCICGADKKMFQLKCSNTGQTLHICWNCAKDIAEQHFSEQNFKIEARWKEVEPRELICTNCGGYAPMNYMHEHYVETTFCPHCGAKVKKGD